jgi:integrase
VIENTNERFANLLRALAWTGARLSTVRRVEARHYGPSLKVWDVEGLYRDRKSHRKMVRRIWPSPQMVTMVERLNQEHPDGPIFRNMNDKPYTGDGVTMTMFKLRERLKKQRPPIELPVGLSVYGLRHTFATQFIVQHPDKLEYLRELLGHKDLKMIRKHYGHLFEESAALHGVLADMKTL